MSIVMDMLGTLPGGGGGGQSGTPRRGRECEGRTVRKLAVGRCVARVLKPLSLHVALTL